MSYQYVEFDGVSLPLYDHNQVHSPMQAESTLQDSIGGVYDWRGTARRKGRKQIIPVVGVYFGELEYLVDETGDVLIDDTSDPLIAGNATQILLAQVTALMEKVGVQGPLWRERLDDGVLEWKTARLLDVPWPRKWEDHAIKADISCNFETQMQWWHAATATATTGSASNGVPLGLTVDNAGRTVDDAVITIARTSGTITAVSLTCAALGIDIAWTGSIGSGQTLTINCLTQTVRIGTTDNYSGFSLGSSHTAAGWLPISPGHQSFVATVTGGNATVTITHYNQYP